MIYENILSYLKDVSILSEVCELKNLRDFSPTEYKRFLNHYANIDKSKLAKEMKKRRHGRPTFRLRGFSVTHNDKFKIWIESMKNMNIEVGQGNKGWWLKPYL